MFYFVAKNRNTRNLINKFGIIARRAYFLEGEKKIGDYGNMIPQ